ncbi:hypothetical protein SLA2020_061020 [Shorea laevis]
MQSGTKRGQLEECQMIGFLGDGASGWTRECHMYANAGVLAEIRWLSLWRVREARSSPPSLQWPYSAAAAVSSALCFLSFPQSLSFLVPTPMDSDQFHRTHSVSIGTKDSIRIRDSMFHIPSGGEKLDRDIWSSRNFRFFYGCSNASSKFAKGEAVARASRFLAIATSGGLNQQRTGVTF